MPDHALNPARASLLRRLLTLEPALVRGVITALVFVAALWGLDIADVGEKVSQTLLVLLALVPMIQAWWTRGVVTPDAKVVQSVEPNGDVVAGPASALPTGMVIRRDGDEHGTIHPLGAGD